MRFQSVTEGVVLALLAAAPLGSAYVLVEGGTDKRHVGGLASLASKLVRDVLPAVQARQVPPPDEFGPWDTTVDEFGSWVDKAKREAEPEPHHTEAQIAAKKKAQGKQKQSRQVPPPDEFGPWDTTVDEFGSWVDKAKREAEPEPHHTEAQIAAKKKAQGKQRQSRQVPPPDEFGPWDTTVDEFGSWVDGEKREAEPEPHHTEAQIAAKKKAAQSKQNQARDPHHTEAQIAAKKKAAQSKQNQARDPHHTEAQIAAKKKAAQSKQNQARDPHHTEAQIAAKEKAAAKNNNQARDPHHTEAQIAAKQKAQQGTQNNNGNSNQNAENVASTKGNGNAKA